MCVYIQAFSHVERRECSSNLQSSFKVNFRLIASVCALAKLRIICTPFAYTHNYHIPHALPKQTIYVTYVVCRMLNAWRIVRYGSGVHECVHIQCVCVRLSLRMCVWWYYIVHAHMFSYVLLIVILCKISVKLRFANGVNDK